LILVSHDRWFVSRLADRIVEITAEGIRDYHGTYEDYVHFCGDDHLDVDTVVLKARTKKKVEKIERRKKGGAGGKSDAGARKAAKRRLDEITGKIEETESLVAGIDAKFADPTFYETTDRGDVRGLEEERARLQSEVESLMDEWQRVEEELG
ncbi:MAG: hypothetical protein M8861_01180, partial [marine benthic group bacterium]|nr:hypothetical protein [Gemmatimonadota bacterium]